MPAVRDDEKVLERYAINEIRDSIGGLVPRCKFLGERFVVTVYGKDAVAIVPLADLDRLFSLDAEAPAAR